MPDPHGEERDEERARDERMLSKLFTNLTSKPRLKAGPIGLFNLKGSTRKTASQLFMHTARREMELLQRLQDKDAMVLRHLHRIEQSGKWRHPLGEGMLAPYIYFGLGMLSSGMRSGLAYLQTERAEDLLGALIGFYSAVTLFFALVGVAALEFSADYTRSEQVMEMGDYSLHGAIWLAARFCWQLLAMVCLACVASCIVNMQALSNITPLLMREYVIQHAIPLSRVVALAVSVWYILLAGFVLQAFVEPPTSPLDLAFSIAGIIAGLLMAGMLYASTVNVGYTAWRPWPEAVREAEMEQARKEYEAEADEELDAESGMRSPVYRTVSPPPRSLSPEPGSPATTTAVLGGL
ncbi:unnamed protein product [Chrysoparadoxa australica]